MDNKVIPNGRTSITTLILFIHEVAIVAHSNIQFPCFSSTMAFSTCFFHSKIDNLWKTTILKGQKYSFPIRNNLIRDWSFIGGSRIVVKQKVIRLVASPKKASPVNASLLSGSQLASSAFTIGTAAVLPFYALMALAPNSELTKKYMQSNVPFVILGILYAYLLYLSWTPETVELLFASKYLLPELTSIGKMFSSEMTLASAWIHLLVIDLFAARQVFTDGQENQIETRHSVSLCLFFCPIGILSHVITKAMTKTTKENKHGL